MKTQTHFYPFQYLAEIPRLPQLRVTEVFQHLTLEDLERLGCTEKEYGAWVTRVDEIWSTYLRETRWGKTMPVRRNLSTHKVIVYLGGLDEMERLLGYRTRHAYLSELDTLRLEYFSQGLLKGEVFHKGRTLKGRRA